MADRASSTEALVKSTTGSAHHNSLVSGPAKAERAHSGEVGVSHAAKLIQVSAAQTNSSAGPCDRMEIAEKAASRRKKAGFTFRRPFGETMGQQPVITSVPESCSLRYLACNEILEASSVARVQARTLKIAEPTMVPIPQVPAT